MTKTRPAQPGDILWATTSPSGVTAQIVVTDPAPHPAKGTTADYDIRLRGTVLIPSGQDGILPAFRSDATVFGETVGEDWGYYDDDDDDDDDDDRVVSGLAIAPLVAQLSAELAEAVAAAEAIYDAHHASRAAQASARAAAYAAWPVRAAEDDDA